MAQPGGNYPGAPQQGSMGPVVRFEVIGEAWRLFQQQMGVWIAAELIFVLLMVGFEVLFVFGGALTGTMGRGGGPSVLFVMFELAAMFAMIVVEWFFMAGLMRLAIKQVKGEAIEFKDVFSVGDMLPTLIGAAILIGLATMAGSLCFIIPGLIIGSLLMLTYPLILDKRLGVTEAMRQSWDALKGQWLMATLFYFVIALVAEAGAIACGVGVLFTLPLAFLSYALMYRDFFLNTMNPASPYGNYPIPPGGGYTPPLYGSDVAQPTSSYTPPTGTYTPPPPPMDVYTPPPTPPTDVYTPVYTPPPSEEPPIVESTSYTSEETPVVETPTAMPEEIPVVETQSTHPEEPPHPSHE